MNIRILYAIDSLLSNMNCNFPFEIYYYISSRLTELLNLPYILSLDQLYDPIPLHVPS